MQKPRTLAPGVQYFTGAQSKNRRILLDRFQAVCEGWCYQEIVLPIIDYAHSFHFALGPELEKQMYSFVDRDGSLLALRPDLTTLVAKVVASQTNNELPLRLWYDGEVFRYEDPKAGQQREFYQAGIEVFGNAAVSAEIEVLLVMLEALESAGLTNAIVPLGHAEFFAGIVEALNLSEEDRLTLKDLIDHKDSWGIGQMISTLDLSSAKQEFLRALPRLAGGPEVLDRAERVVQNQKSRRALDRLVAIHDELTALGLERHFLIDLAEVRNLDYYTGLIFKIYSENLGFEIGGGGRYDSLTEKFGQPLPAVGFSVSVERLMAALSLPAPEGSISEKASTFEQARRLRRENKKVRVEWVS